MQTVLKPAGSDDVQLCTFFFLFWMNYKRIPSGAVYSRRSVEPPRSARTLDRVTQLSCSQMKLIFQKIQNYKIIFSNKHLTCRWMTSGKTCHECIRSFFKRLTMWHFSERGPHQILSRNQLQHRNQKDRYQTEASALLQFVTNKFSSPCLLLLLWWFLFFFYLNTFNTSYLANKAQVVLYISLPAGLCCCHFPLVSFLY